MKVLVEYEDLQQLLHDSYVLDALEYGGVDNWMWYDEARSNYLEERKVNTFDELVEQKIQDYEVIE